MNRKRMIFSVCLLIVMFFSLFIIRNIEVNAEDITEEKNSEISVMSGDKNDYEPVQISAVPSSDVKDIKYIDNADYFKVNPKHAENSTTDNSAGTCTTVAVQLLIGYHNYYTDRRIIPEFNESGERLLAEDYGDIMEHPSINKQ